MNDLLSFIQGKVDGCFSGARLLGGGNTDLFSLLYQSGCAGDDCGDPFGVNGFGLILSGFLCDGHMI